MYPPDSTPVLTNPEESLRAVRLLRLVDYLVMHDAATFDELCAALNLSEHAVRQDLSLLARGGVSIRAGPDRRMSLEHMLPGLALRLTLLEAAFAWLRLMHQRAQCLSSGDPLEAESVLTACRLLEMGLRKYHPGAEGLAQDFDEVVRRIKVWAAHPKDQFAPANVRGQAEQMCRRLRAYELIEAGKATNREQLMAILGDGDRTIGKDIQILRAAGLRVIYSRGDHAYRVDSLHSFLNRTMTDSRGRMYARFLSAIFSGPDGFQNRNSAILDRNCCNKLKHSIDAALRSGAANSLDF